MTKASAADYTPDAIGRRFPKCGTHGLRTLRAVRMTPDDGWGLLCPGPARGEHHVIPVCEPRNPNRFGACRVCGAETTAIRAEASEGSGIVDRFSLVDCGHTIAVPWPLALALV